MIENGGQKNKKKLGNIAVSEALLIAILPFLAYLYTLVYQAGYVKSFSLPFQFVTVTIPDIFNIGSKVLGIFGIVLGCIYLFSTFLPKGKLPYSLAKRISQLLPIFLLAFPFLVFFEWGTGGKIFLFFLSFAIFIMFFPALVTRRYKGTYLEKMELIDKEIKDDDPWEGNLLSKVVDFIGHKAFVAILYCLLSIYITYNAGIAAAQNQKIFYLVNTSPVTVVLLVTNEKIISAPFDNNTKIIKPEFFITNISDSSDLKLRLSDVGNLRLDISSIAPLSKSTSMPITTLIPTVKYLVTETKAP